MRFDAGSGDVDALSARLAAGDLSVDGSADGWTPLLCAAENGQAEAAALLLGAGADPDLAVGGRASPLAIAAGAGDVELVDLLLGEGADPNSQLGGTTPLIEAAEAEQPDLIATLVAEGADPDAPNDRGITPLVGAIGRPSSTEALLTAGADPNEVAQVDGRSVLLVSGLWRTPLSTGVAEPLTHGRGDSTALHAAVLTGDADSVRLLLEAGADPDAIAYDAFTPLHLALGLERGADDDIARLLLEAGADPTLAPNDAVGTPADLAAATRP
ncbi:hypothetical protein B7486_57545 [cyanobacterium TDX16]|nr:hypothetical protein B7486_57545 [cyanobacterium TDX16]